MPKPRQGPPLASHMQSAYQCILALLFSRLHRKLHRWRHCQSWRRARRRCLTSQPRSLGRPRHPSICTARPSMCQEAAWNKYSYSDCIVDNIESSLLALPSPHRPTTTADCQHCTASNNPNNGLREAPSLLTLRDHPPTTTANTARTVLFQTMNSARPQQCSPPEKDSDSEIILTTTANTALSLPCSKQWTPRGPVNAHPPSEITLRQRLPTLFQTMHERTNFFARTDPLCDYPADAAADCAAITGGPVGQPLENARVSDC